MVWSDNVESDSMEVKALFSERYGVTDACFELLITHLRMVLEANKTTNITGIKDYSQAIYLHIYDSLLGLSQLEAASEGLFADIGSGAGYPGIPLSVCCNRAGVLIESLKKKALILEGMVSKLGLAESLTVMARRSEQEAAENPGAYTAVVVRAVGSLSTIMELACPLLCTDGILIAYKGPEWKVEMELAEKTGDLLGMQISEVEEHAIPVVEAKRFIIAVKKTGIPQIDLPRRPGQAQRKPLFS